MPSVPKCRLFLWSFLCVGLACESRSGTSESALRVSPSSRIGDVVVGRSAAGSLSAEPLSTVSIPASQSASAGRVVPELETVQDEPDGAEVSEPAEASCAPIDPQLKPIQVLRFAFTDSVEGKDVREKLSVARPGQRIHSHLVLRNRSGRERCVKLELRVNGEARTTLIQKVGRSWSWRTWGYNTLRKDDRGTLEAIVRDDQGVELVRRALPIVPEP